MLTRRIDNNYYSGRRNQNQRQNPCCSYGTINISANIPPVMALSMPQCTNSVRTGAVRLWESFLTLGLYASRKRVEPLINQRRHNMCKNLIASNNTTLLKVQENIGDVQASLKYLTESTSCESGTLGQISCLLNVLADTLRSAYSDLAEYTLENNINYDKASVEVA